MLLGPLIQTETPERCFSIHMMSSSGTLLLQLLIASLRGLLTEMTTEFRVEKQRRLDNVQSRIGNAHAFLLVFTPHSCNSTSTPDTEYHTAKSVKIPIQLAGRDIADEAVTSHLVHHLVHHP